LTEGKSVVAVSYFSFRGTITIISLKNDYAMQQYYSWISRLSSN